MFGVCQGMMWIVGSCEVRLEHFSLNAESFLLYHLVWWLWSCVRTSLNRKVLSLWEQFDRIQFQIISLLAELCGKRSVFSGYRSDIEQIFFGSNSRHYNNNFIQNIESNKSMGTCYFINGRTQSFKKSITLTNWYVFFLLISLLISVQIHQTLYIHMTFT